MAENQVVGKLDKYYHRRSVVNEHDQITVCPMSEIRQAWQTTSFSSQCTLSFP